MSLTKCWSRKYVIWPFSLNNINYVHAVLLYDVIADQRYHNGSCDVSILPYHPPNLLREIFYRTRGSWSLHRVWKTRFSPRSAPVLWVLYRWIIIISCIVTGTRWISHQWLSTEPLCRHFVFLYYHYNLYQSNVTIFYNWYFYYIPIDGD